VLYIPVEPLTQTTKYKFILNNKWHIYHSGMRSSGAKMNLHPIKLFNKFYNFVSHMQIYVADSEVQRLEHRAIARVSLKLL